MPPHGKLTNDLSELVHGKCQARGVSLAFRVEVPLGWREPPGHHREGGFVLGCKARWKVSRKKDWNWDQKLDVSWAPVPSSLRARSRRPGGEGSRAAVTGPGPGTGLTTSGQLAVPFPCLCAMGTSRALPPQCGSSTLELTLSQQHPRNMSSVHTSHSFPTDLFSLNLSEISQTRISLQVPPPPGSTTLGSRFILLGTAICSCVKWRKWCLTELWWRWMIVNRPVRV